MLYDEKPEVPKAILKDLRKKKWIIAEEAEKELRKLGFYVEMFECPYTPHMRVLNVDYWPASSRFYDRIKHKWGIGYENYKYYVSNVKLKLGI